MRPRPTATPRALSFALAATTALALTQCAADPELPTARSSAVKVFVLLGQSDMVGFGRIAQTDRRGALEQLCKEQGKYPHLLDPEGGWAVRDDAWCVKTTVGQRQGWLQPGLGARAEFVGPALQRGHVFGDALDEPVLVTKASQGNRSLGRVYPGYGDTPSSWVEGEPKESVDWYAGKQYDDFVRGVHEVLDDLPRFFPDYDGRGYEIAGFAWWQGHEDQNAAHASRHEQSLARLIETLRAEFDAPDAPFVLATIAFGGAPRRSSRSAASAATTHSSPAT